MKIRKAVEKDLNQIAKLYAETVRAVNSKDYSKEHVEVWSCGGENPEGWKRRITEQYFLIAEIGKQVVGFSSITPNGYLDFMYVHKDFQRKGIASKLLIEIERKAAEQKNNEIYSHVSKTARGFFEKSGYKYFGDLIDPYKGVIFINNLMKKNIKQV